MWLLKISYPIDHKTNILGAQNISMRLFFRVAETNDKADS